MTMFRVSVYDKDAFVPINGKPSRTKGHYVTKLETSDLFEAASFMKEQTTSCSLQIQHVPDEPYRVIYIRHPEFQ